MHLNWKAGKTGPYKFKLQTVVDRYDSEDDCSTEQNVPSKFEVESNQGECHR